MSALLFNRQPLVRETQWSLPLLRQMDWKSVQELVLHLLRRGGFAAEVAWIRPDASVMISVTNPRQRGRLEALLQCAPWAPLSVDSTARLKELYQSVLAEGAARGIYVTPGDFTEDVRVPARDRSN